MWFIFSKLSILNFYVICPLRDCEANFALIPEDRHLLLLLTLCFHLFSSLTVSCQNSWLCYDHKHLRTDQNKYQFGLQLHYGAIQLHYAVSDFVLQQEAQVNYVSNQPFDELFSFLLDSIPDLLFSWMHQTERLQKLLIQEDWTWCRWMSHGNQAMWTIHYST